MINKQLNSRRDELIEILGEHFKEVYSLPPLGGRIWACIILEGKLSGITFDYLVDKFQSSKSSISTNLKFLLDSQKIFFETFPGDRKKYFKPFPFSDRFTKILHHLESEMNIIDKILEYKKEFSAHNQFTKIDLDNTIAFKDHLIEMHKLTQKTLLHLKEIEEINKKNNNT